MDLFEKRILIVKPSSLGDIIHTLPLAHALKRCFPSCTLGWIVQDAFAGLLECDETIDHVHPIHISSTSDPQAGRFSYFHAFKETLATLQLLRYTLKQHPYDIVLDLHASFRSGLLGRTNPGGIRIGFKDARELNTFFQQQRIEVPQHVVHALDKNLLFVDYLGCSRADVDLYLSSSRNDVRVAQKVLHEQGAKEGRPLIYANPAARWQTKFWSKEKWAELADRFSAQGWIIVFGGSVQDTIYIKSITDLMHSRPVTVGGRLSLSESAALIKQCCLYVGLDSGPMHMASLAGIPVVALFGPTHPDRVGPYRVDYRLVRAEQLDCLECRKRSCDHHSCMKKISVDMVYDAAVQLMSQQAKSIVASNMGSVAAKGPGNKG